MIRSERGSWIGVAGRLLLGAVFACACVAVPAQTAPYDRLTGVFTGPNGLPVPNNVISFEPTQMFFVPGTNSTTPVDNIVSNVMPTNPCAIEGQLYTYTGTAPPTVYQCVFGVWIQINGSELTLEHGGSDLPDQSLLNFVDTPESLSGGALDPGYQTVKFKNDSVGGLAAETLSANGQFLMAQNAPTTGQYVIVYPTAFTSGATGQGFATGGNTGGSLGSAELISPSSEAGTSTIRVSSPALPSYVSPGNVTAIYAFQISSSAAGPLPTGGAALCGGMTGIPWAINDSFVTHFTASGTGAANQDLTSGAGESYPLGQVTVQMTGLTGANFHTAAIEADFDTSGDCLSSAGTNIPLVGWYVYYTGSAPPATTAIQVVPPLNYNSTLNQLGIDPLAEFPGTALVPTIVKGLPAAASFTNWVFGVTDGTSSSDCSTGGGSTYLQCKSNGSAWSAYVPSGAMVYPGAGVANSTGSAWGTSYAVGASANDLVQLNGSAQLPAVSAALLTNFPTLNQNTTGNAATASALAATPSLCSTGDAPTGVLANGNATGCAPIGGSGGGFNGINAQTSSYTALSGDNGKNIVFNCPSACSLTLPSTPPSSTWAISVQNTSQVALGITVPGSLTLDGLAGAASLTPNMGTLIWTDGTNYFTERGSIISRSNTVPTLVQSFLLNDNTGPTCSNFSVTPCNSITTPGNVSPGSALIVEFYHSNGGTVNTPTDTQGDTFTQTNNQLISGEFNFLQYVACNVVGGPTTVSMAGNNAWNMIAVYEIAGAAASSCADANSSQQTTTGTTSTGTGSITTTAAYDFILVTGAGRTATTGGTLSEANSYTNLFQSGNVANLYYGSWYGIKNATGSLSDTVTSSVAFGGMYAGIVAIKPTAASTAFVQGDIVAAGPTTAPQPLHPGTSGNVLTSNGPGALPSYQAPLAGTAVKQNSGSTIPSLSITGYMPQVCADTSGSGTAQSCATATTFTPQADNCVVYTTTTTNSGTGLTVNINSLGAKSIAVASSSGWSTTLVASTSIPANKPMHLCYDGTNWDASGTGVQAAGGSSGAWTNITGGVTVAGCAVSSGACVVSGSSTSAVTFSVIPGTYNALQLMIWGQSSALATMQATFNSDTSAHYIVMGYVQNTAALAANATPSPPGTYCSIGGITNGVISQSIADVLFYASTAFGKALTAHSIGIGSISGTSPNYDEGIGCGYNQTTAITSVTITLSTGDYASGTRFEILAQQ